MKYSWKSIRLGEVISHKKSFTIIDDFLKYKLCRVQTKALGVVLREEKEGCEIKTKKQQVCKSGDLIFAEMDARFGGYGIIPDELDGSIVSSHYFLFDINDSLIDRTYLEYCLKQPWFLSQIEAKGSTNYAAIRPYHVLDYTIPLPPLSEQQRIVSKIKSIKTKLDKIKVLRLEQEINIDNFRFSLMSNIEKEYARKKIGDTCILQKGQFPIMQTEAGEYPFVVTAQSKKTANSFDFDCEAVCIPLVSSTGHGNAAMHRVHYHSGKFALANLLCAVIPNNPEVLSAKFLYELFMAKKNEYFVPLMSGTSNVSLNINKISSVKIPIPTIEFQNKIVLSLTKLYSVKDIHEQQNKELSELMPSLLDKAFKGELNYAEQEENLRIAAEPAPNYFTIVKSNIPENKKSFAKQVLGGKIVSLFCDDKNFSHIKFQKLQYIAEHVIEEDLHWNYYRQSAGPYDNRFMHSVIFNLSRNKWFEERDYKFYPLEKATDIDKYYQTYFGDKNDKLNKLFCLLKNASEKFCEAVATIYAVWNNHIIQNQQFNKEKIKTDFFAWSNRKENLFTDDEFEKALLWMQNNSIEPTGFGQLIKERK